MPEEFAEAERRFTRAGHPQENCQAADRRSDFRYTNLAATSCLWLIRLPQKQICEIVSSFRDTTANYDPASELADLWRLTDAAIPISEFDSVLYISHNSLKPASDPARKRWFILKFSNCWVKHRSGISHLKNENHI